MWRALVGLAFVGVFAAACVDDAPVPAPIATYQDVIDAPQDYVGQRLEFTAKPVFGAFDKFPNGTFVFAGSMSGLSDHNGALVTIGHEGPIQLDEYTYFMAENGVIRFPLQPVLVVGEVKYSPAATFSDMTPARIRGGAKMVRGRLLELRRMNMLYNGAPRSMLAPVLTDVEIDAPL